MPTARHSTTALQARRRAKDTSSRVLRAPPKLDIGPVRPSLGSVRQNLGRFRQSVGGDLEHIVGAAYATLAIKRSTMIVVRPPQAARRGVLDADAIAPKWSRSGPILVGIAPMWPLIGNAGNRQAKSGRHRPRHRPRAPFRIGQHVAEPRPIVGEFVPKSVDFGRHRCKIRHVQAKFSRFRPNRGPV